MKVEIKGNKIFTINDFHQQIAKLLDLGSYYGNNFNALWDSLTTDVERPVSLIWLDSAISRENLGDEAFNMIVQILQKVQDYDVEASCNEKFTFELR